MGLIVINVCYTIIPNKIHKFERAWKVSSLINNFGKQAVLVLAGHGIGADTAARILRDYIDEDEMYKQIYKAERQYIITRGFWDN